MLESIDLGVSIVTGVNQQEILEILGQSDGKMFFCMCAYSCGCMYVCMYIYIYIYIYIYLQDILRQRDGKMFFVCVHICVDACRYEGHVQAFRGNVMMRCFLHVCLCVWFVYR